MFAKLKKRIEEETETGLATSQQGPFVERSNRASLSPAISSSSIPDLHGKVSLREGSSPRPNSDSQKVTNVVEKPRRQSSLPDQSYDKDFALNEHNDELQDFQKQEVAKVKHLLILCENELKACKSQLEQSNEKVSSTTAENSKLSAENVRLTTEADEKSKLALKLEQVVEQLTDSNSQMIVKLEEKEQKIKKLQDIEISYNKLKKEQLKSMESLKSEILNEKNLLIEEIDQMKKKNLECSHRISYLESILNDRTDEFAALKHTHDTYRTKTSSILEDKETTIQNLEEKVKILEKRVNDSSLCDDEKIQSVVQERNHLEQMLDESRLQLSEIKMSWSDKINNLETQISHLNRKMAEDSEESQKFESKCQELSDEVSSYSAQCETLRSENEALSEVKSENDVVKSELDHCKSERDRLRIENEELNGNLRATRKELSACQEIKRKFDGENKQKIDELMGQHSEHLEKEIENENKISTYEESIKKLKIEVSSMEKELSSSKDLISSLTKRSETAEDEQKKASIKIDEHAQLLNEKTRQIENLEVELDTAQQERDSLLMRNSELSQQSEMAKQELNEEHMNKDRMQTEMQESNQELHKQLKELKTKVTSLEASAVTNVENSVRVAELKTSVVDLESQLAEKNKVIKLQQQRLSDMKKTLVKELKMQQNGDNDTVGDGLDIALLGINKLNKCSTKNATNNSNNGLMPSQDFAGPTTEVNIQYLRHVVFKFMTSREYEAQHLIKAVSVLLKFTKEQENLIRETLDWKMSWFGHKPEMRKSFKS